MFLSKPSGIHIWSKDSNEFPFSSQGCINQSFSGWQVSSWFWSEKPSLSKYPKANHMGGRGIKQIQNRTHCSWNGWMFVAKQPCAKIPLPFIQSWQPTFHFHEKRRKGYTIPCLWEGRVVHYSVNLNQCVWLRLDSKSKDDLPELPTDSGLSLEVFLVAALCSSTSWRRSQIWLDQIL